MPRRILTCISKRAHVGVPDAVSQHKQRDTVFAQMKRSFLTKPDKSRAGSVDPLIEPVCAVLNNMADVFTTSSCSGRAVLWQGEDPPSKRRGTPRFKPLSEHDPDRAHTLLQAAAGILAGSQQGDEDLTFWLRYEPMILHMNCRDLGAVRKVLAAARTAGLKRTAIFAPGPRLVAPRKVKTDCGVNGAVRPDKVPRTEMRSWRLCVEGDERLEMPLIIRGQPCYPLGEERLQKWLLDALLRKFERNLLKTRRFQSTLTVPPRGADIEQQC